MAAAASPAAEPAEPAEPAAPAEPAEAAAVLVLASPEASDALASVAASDAAPPVAAATASTPAPAPREPAAPAREERGSPAPARESCSLRPLVDFRDVTESMLLIEDVACVALSDRGGAFGTRQGSIFQIDLAASRTSKVATNGAPVQCLSLDAEARFVASGADDGRVTVLPLRPGSGEAWICEHGALPVLGVALCPEYGSSSSAEGFAVCAGGEEGRLALHRRRLLGTGRSVLHEGEGAVARIAWRGSLIAWANDRGIKVFDVLSGQKVTFIPKPAAAPAGGSLGAGRCCLAWAGDDRLLVGWGTVVKVAVVLGQRPASAPGAPGSGLYVQVQHQFVCPESVCGLAPVCAGNLCVAMSAANGASPAVSLSLCNCSGDVFHTAAVPLRSAFPSHVHIAAVAPHLPMYLAAAQDLIIFEIRDLLEHAVQLLERGLYEEAIRLADGGGDCVEGLRHIVCLKCVAPDLRAGNFERACATVGRFRHLEGPTWQECVVLFDRFGGLQHLAVSIPVPPRGTRLPREVYDEALLRLVPAPAALVAVLSWWPADIFSGAALKACLKEHLPDLEASRVQDLGGEARTRVEALAMLAVADGDLQEAVRLFLDLGSPAIFRLLQRDCAGERRLAALAEASVKRLFEIDDHEACRLLVANHSAVPADSVVAALGGCDTRWRFEYLKQLFSKDEVAGQRYHMQMVRLFAEYEPQALLAFLRASERYPLEDALGVCQQRGLLEEEAYLLGRAGRVGEALKVLLERVGDVGRAVEFAAEYQDPKLWELLISFVLEHPHLLVPLLERLDALDALFGKVGQDYGRPQLPPSATPAHVLRRLPVGTPVPRIAASVRRVFDSFELSRSLHESCNRLSMQEMQARKRAFIAVRQRGTLVAPSSRRCSVCGRLIGWPPPDEAPEAAGCLGAPAEADGLPPQAADAQGGAAASSSCAPPAWQASGARAAPAAPTAPPPGSTAARAARAEASKRAGIVLLGRGAAAHARCTELNYSTADEGGGGLGPAPAGASGAVGDAAAASAGTGLPRTSPRE